MRAAEQTAAQALKDTRTLLLYYSIQEKYLIYNINIYNNVEQG